VVQKSVDRFPKANTHFHLYISFCFPLAKDIQPAPRFDFKKYVKNVGDGYSMRPFDILQRQIQVKSSGVGDSSTAHTNQTRTFAAAFFTFTCPKESRLDCIGIVIRGRGNNPSNQVVLLMHQFG
jgi:hypothetical protein